MSAADATGRPTATTEEAIVLSSATGLSGYVLTTYPEKAAQGPEQHSKHLTRTGGTP